MQNRFAVIAFLIVGAFAGGLIGRQIPGLSRHVDSDDPAYTENNKVHEYFYDASGRGRVDLGIFSGQPIQDFWSGGRDSKLRLQLGTYTDDMRADEKGLPVVTFYNRKNALKELLRLDGSNQSPLLILKDNREGNRIIMGLGLTGAGEEPFFAYFTKDGKQHMLFGNFSF